VKVMHKLRTAAAAAVLVVANTQTMAAGAMGIVFDPAVFGQTLESAIQGVMEVENGLEQVLKQAELLKDSRQNLKNLGRAFQDYVDPWVWENADALIRFGSQVKDLEKDLNKLQDRFESRTAAAYSSKMTIEEFVRWQKEQATQGRKVAQAAIDEDVRTLERVSKGYEMVRAWQDKIPNIQGNVEGLQLLNSQMNGLLGQNAELVSALTRQSIFAKEEADRRAGHEEAQKDVIAREMARAREDHSEAGRAHQGTVRVGGGQGQGAQVVVTSDARQGSGGPGGRLSEGSGDVVQMGKQRRACRFGECRAARAVNGASLDGGPGAHRNRRDRAVGARCHGCGGCQAPSVGDMGEGRDVARHARRACSTA
jgi:P-type conjugative transfer protein TrbJ